MTLVALTSAKGSPGVTTLSCILGAVWPSERRIVVAEMDPSGCDIATWHLMAAQPGMTTLILEQRQRKGLSPEYDRHCQQLSGGLEVLVGPLGADSARSLDGQIPIDLRAIFSEDVDFVVDCGRLQLGAQGQESVLANAEKVIVVTPPKPSDTLHVKWIIGHLRSISPEVAISIAVLGGSTLDAREISTNFGLEFGVSIPHDAKSASVVCGRAGSSRAFAKSKLVRAARGLADRLIGGIDEQVDEHRSVEVWSGETLQEGDQDLFQGTQISSVSDRSPEGVAAQ